MVGPAKAEGPARLQVLSDRTTSGRRGQARQKSPVWTVASLSAPSLLEIAVRRYGVPGRRPPIWQTQAVPEAPSGWQPAA